MAEEASPELIERAKGDRAAFGRLYDFYVERIYGFALCHARTREEAEDLTAQTFERALGSIARYEARGAPFSAWLYRIAANLAVDRARRRHGVVLVDEAGLPEKPARDVESDPPRMLEQWEEANRLLNHLATLPPDQEEAVQRRFWKEQSFSEIGQAMGRSEAAARQLVYRAIRALRVQLESEVQGNA